MLIEGRVSPADYREPGEEQTEGGGALCPHPPHEHPGHGGGSHSCPPGCQPVSLPLFDCLINRLAPLHLVEMDTEEDYFIF